ncbi:MAG: hypothetical protein K2P79_01825 [Sphingomonas sp.]|nr:hypothetical protein [Sphingomonas sp.]
MNAQTMRQIRQIHRYMGLLFTPAILFFAFSGMLQTFDFHEPEKGAAPPRWIAVIAAIHKKQAMPRPRAKRPAPAGEAAQKPGSQKAGAAGPAAARSPFALKVFVGLMSIGLMLSSLLGAAIALYGRTTRRSAVILLAVGTLLPVALLLF